MVILVFSTILDYTCGNIIYNSSNERKRKWILFISMFINLFVLAYFKYAYFFTESFNALFETKYVFFNHFAQWTNTFWGEELLCVDRIILPVGISFFTFQTMSYTIDIYRRQLTPVKNIVDFGFFVTFFPQLVAGPIVRASEFIPQMYQPYSLDRHAFGWSLFMILKGLIKKIVVADYIALNFIDHVFQNPDNFPGFVIIFALWGYSMQIYGDFSGYTDIAIGVSRLLGFQLSTNFNSPYKAINVADFWRRWHISLSSFLKDYLYIPLGGNKKATWVSYLFVPFIIFFLAGLIDYYFDIESNLFGTHFEFGFWVLCIIFMLLFLFLMLFERVRTFMNTDINLLITMLLGGLWHGASMKFIIWGGLNGIALVIYKYWKRVSPYEKSNFFLTHFWKIFFTFNFITFTRIFFRATDMENANFIIGKIWNNFGLFTSDEAGISHFNTGAWSLLFTSYAVVLIIMAVAYFIHWLPTKTKDSIQNSFIKLPMSMQMIVTVLAGFLIYQAVSADFTPFIYFQF
jgi:D-alanyl-lipoteichoic acid acyltransferase DltB (MBOAT superfamily)